MNTVANLTLNNGLDMPQLGFGVFQVPPEDTEAAVTAALQAGYRSIDTAAAYRNEAGVAEAIRKSGLRRDDLFVTTKLWNDDHGYDNSQRAFDASLSRLGLDYVDLYLIHWPCPTQDRYVETWQAFEKIAAGGRARAIGVSNFQPQHLRRLLDETSTTPALNQIELHPSFVQSELRAVHAEHGIATEAWSPLGQGAELTENTVTGLAQKYGVAPAQVVLRWHLQLGNVVIPKSVTPSRIAENFDVFGFELAPDDVDAVTAMDRRNRIGPNPDDFG